MKTITKKMLDDFEKVIKAWQHKKCDDKSLIALYKSDRRDLTKALNLLKKHKVEQAGELIYNLDTTVRDIIPAKLYNTIFDIMGYD